MKDLKFRIWDNVDYMSSPFTLHDIQTKQIQFTDYVQVMQYTGLKDKNGVEIYEGDILQNQYRGNGVVKYGNFICDSDFHYWTIGFYIETDDRDFDDDEPHYRKHCLLSGNEENPACDFTIIGNIYQHPDLIK